MAAGDRDTTIPGQQRLDASLHYKLSKDTTLSFDINNLQNSTQRMPTYTYRNVLSGGPGRITNNGAVREGRNFLIELTYKF